jgi:GT2 family glycosyltransferase
MTHANSDTQHAAGLNGARPHMSSHDRASHSGTPDPVDAPRWPAVTVVIPTRGRPQLLARALRSIFSQRYDGEIECLVVLDGRHGDPQAGDEEMRDLPSPPAGSGRILTMIPNTRKPGLAGARNTGILAAKGDLVAFCDDDDEWLPDKLRAQVPHLMAGGVSAVCCGIDVCYRDKVVSRMPKKELVAFADLLRDRLTDMHPSTFIARRDDVIAHIGLVDEEIPGSYAEDYEWLLRAARMAPIRTVDKPLARIHWHKSSFFEGRWDTIIPALEYLIAKHPEFHDQAHGLARIYGQIAFAHAAAGRRRNARTWTRRSLRLDWRQPRPYLALLVSVGIVRPAMLLNVLHQFGRGV